MHESKETVLNNMNIAICRNPRSKDVQAGNNASIFACAYTVFAKDHYKNGDKPERQRCTCGCKPAHSSGGRLTWPLKENSSHA